MTAQPEVRPVPVGITDDQLADALAAGAVAERWGERAAVGLLIAHGSWLHRGELRRAVETQLGLDGELFAWVVWDRVDLAGATASSSEVRVLTLACSLGGVPSDRPLSDLLSSLDPTDIVRVLDAVWLACTGHGLTRRHAS